MNTISFSSLSNNKEGSFFGCLCCWLMVSAWRCFWLSSWVVGGGANNKVAISNLYSFPYLKYQCSCYFYKARKIYQVILIYGKTDFCVVFYSAEFRQTKLRFQNFTIGSIRHRYILCIQNFQWGLTATLHTGFWWSFALSSSNPSVFTYHRQIRYAEFQLCIFDSFRICLVFILKMW